VTLKASTPNIVLTDAARGMAWMLGSALCFTIMAICLKLLAQAQYPESQMVFARCAAGFLVILPFALRAGGEALRIHRPGAVFMRGLYSTIGFFAGFYAFAHMPLADAQAISFGRVLFVVIFAVWLLQEKVGWRRWAAVGVGFIGMVMMVKPGMAPLDLATACALASALFFGLAIVTVKDLTKDHSTFTLVLYTNAFTTIAGLPFAFFGWVTPDPWHAVLFIVLGIAGVGAQSCYVRALSHGDASLVGLVDYVRLPMALLFGFLLFAEQPDLLTMVGAAVIIGSTVYIAFREARLRVDPKTPLTRPDQQNPP
jgi:drug/metabolite transporter (DMT)-like permease